MFDFCNIVHSNVPRIDKVLELETPLDNLISPVLEPTCIQELDDIDIEISVLSPLEQIDNPDKIIVGKCGVMVKKGFRSGVYLPQVATETGWNKEEFMNSLCLDKAGLPADSWKNGSCEIYIFTAEVFGEKEEAIQK